MVLQIYQAKSRRTDDQYRSCSSCQPDQGCKDDDTAFAFAKKSVPKLKLWIMGPTDEDEKYAQECFDLVDSLGVSDIELQDGSM